MADHLSDEQLAGHVLATITDEAREHLDQHLQGCQFCRARLSDHEATLRRIRYGLAADLRQASASSRAAFAQVAPAISRARRRSALKAAAGRALAAAPQATLWALIVAILVFIIQGSLWSRPAAPDLAKDAAFENRDLRLHTNQPVLAHGPKGAWDDLYVYPGQVLHHEGAFHMFYSGKAMARHIVSVGYATSADGYTWARETEGPVLTAESVAWPERQIHITANTVLVGDGQWTMYFTASRLNSLLAGQVGRATAPSPIGPWAVDTQPVLTPGASGEWDAGLVGDACVTRSENGYVMFYTGGILHKMIGRADSSDGITWTKYNDPATTEAPFAESDPVLQADEAWEEASLEQACARWRNGRWLMTYVSGGAGGIGYAVSADGVHWLKSPQNPILLADELGLRQGYLYATLAVQEQSAAVYFQPSLLEATGRGIYLATWREP